MQRGSQRTQVEVLQADALAYLRHDARMPTMSCFSIRRSPRILLPAVLPAVIARLAAGRADLRREREAVDGRCAVADAARAEGRTRPLPTPDREA